MRNRWFVAALLLLFLGACSSTGKQSANLAEHGAAAAGTSEESGATNGGAPGATAGGAEAGSVPGGAGSPGSAGEAGAPGGGSVSAAPIPGKKLAGKEILVGFYYTDTGPAIPGVSGLAAGDGRAQAQAVVDYYNKRGGFGGLPVRLVTYGVQIQNYGAAEEQAACTKFTQDYHVQFAFDNAVHSPTYIACLAERGVIMADAALTMSPDVATMRKYAGLLYQITPSADRLGTTLAENLLRRGYFKAPGMKLGVLWGETNYYNRTTLNTFLARIKAAGIKYDPKNVIANDGSDAETQNAIVTHRSNGVTHTVMIGATYGQAQDGQQYYPRLSMLKFPLALAAINATPRALRNMITIGYEPGFDVNAPQEGPLNKSAQLCNQIMRDSGNAPYGTRVAEAQARRGCDSLFWLRAVTNRILAMGGTTITKASVRSAVETLGPTFNEAALHFGQKFGLNRYDGAETYRDLAYNSECECMTYLGGFRQFAQNQPKVYP
jgi:hypothetical protein